MTHTHPVDSIVLSPNKTVQLSHKTISCKMIDDGYVRDNI